MLRNLQKSSAADFGKARMKSKTGSVFASFGFSSRYSVRMVSVFLSLKVAAMSRSEAR